MRGGFVAPRTYTYQHGLEAGLGDRPDGAMRLWDGAIDHTKRNGIGYRWSAERDLWEILPEDQHHTRGPEMHENDPDAVRNFAMKDDRHGTTYEENTDPEKIRANLDAFNAAAKQVMETRRDGAQLIGWSEPALPSVGIQGPPLGVDVPALVEWWLDRAREEAHLTVPKAIEYGSAELVEAGRTLARLMDHGEVTPGFAMEHQIYQYVVGKMGRWTAAMSRGEPVSDDTIFDIKVYCTMVQRIRATGMWP